MSAPCLPYGFPTDYARSPSRVERTGRDAPISNPPPSAMNAGSPQPLLVPGRTVSSFVPVPNARSAVQKRGTLPGSLHCC